MGEGCRAEGIKKNQPLLISLPVSSLRDFEIYLDGWEYSQLMADGREGKQNSGNKMDPA